MPGPVGFELTATSPLVTIHRSVPQWSPEFDAVANVSDFAIYGYSHLPRPSSSSFRDLHWIAMYSTVAASFRHYVDANILRLVVSGNLLLAFFPIGPRPSLDRHPIPSNAAPHSAVRYSNHLAISSVDHSFHQSDSIASSTIVAELISRMTFVFPSLASPTASPKSASQ